MLLKQFGIKNGFHFFFFFFVIISELQCSPNTVILTVDSHKGKHLTSQNPYSSGCKTLFSTYTEPKFIYISAQGPYSPGSYISPLNSWMFFSSWLFLFLSLFILNNQFTTQCVSVSAGLLFFEVQLYVIVSGWQRERPMSHAVTDLNPVQGISRCPNRNKS